MPLGDFDVLVFLFETLKGYRWTKRHNWVTGEPFTYSNWSKNSPTGKTHEKYLVIREFNDSRGIGTWNDTSNDAPKVSGQQGYIIEYSNRRNNRLPQKNNK